MIEITENIPKNIKNIFFIPNSCFFFRMPSMETIVGKADAVPHCTIEKFDIDYFFYLL